MNNDDYKRAISLDLNLVDAYINLGRLYREKGYLQEAIRLFEGGAARAPERAGLYYGLGVAYLELGKREEAVTLLTKACQLNPDLSEAQRALSRASLVLLEHGRPGPP